MGTKTTQVKLVGHYHATLRELAREDMTTTSELLRRLIRAEAERRWKKQLCDVAFLQGGGRVER